MTSRRPTVSPERWARVQEVFHQVLERDRADRTTVLDRACRGDPGLQEMVVSLLEAHEHGGPIGQIDDRTHLPPETERLSLQAALADRYTIERPLGTGGMATVYLAEDLRHGRHVAIKVFSPQFSAALGLARFQREIRIAAALRHPHILPLFDSGEVDDSLYYVMPVEGESLQDRLRREHTIPLDEALAIVGEVLDALDYAHGEGVVHRDIKPANILLSREHAIVADFGIARAISEAGGERVTQTGLQIGTPAYMSPERLAGDPGLDGRSDLYSVGCLLCEMVTGSVPFPGRAGETVDHCVSTGRFPIHVAHAIRTVVAPAPEDRFATAAEFARALTGGTTTARLRHRPNATPAQSIAVLPFTNMSADPDNEYFSDGITEEIINALAHVDGLHVAARMSSFAFKGQTLDITQVGARLRVATVLEGSVRRAGDRLRITAQLINVADGYHLWSERYDRQLNDVFAIQDEIAHKIAERLQVELTQTSRERLVRPPTRDMEAYHLYLKGRHLWHRRTRSALEQAVEYFNEAIARDPDFSSAYAGLADAYILLGSYAHMPQRKALSLANAAAERALELDETLAEAYASRGQVLRSKRDWAGEEAAYRRAIELNPGYATAHQWYATLLAALGRSEEALREIRLAEELDPLSHAISVTVAVVLYLARRYDKAYEQLHRALELEPRFASTHAWLGLLHAQRGEYEAAIEAVDRAVELNPDNPNVLSGLAYAYARMGQRDQALEVLRRATARGAGGWTGMVYAVLGETDEAFACFERSLEREESWDALFYLKTFPWLDSLRSDPRYESLLRRMRFPT